MRRMLIPGLVCLFLAVLYLATLAPGLTWAFDGADGGDLVTAAATGGVPHPTGYPTYLLIASAFLRLPFGSLAYRTNLLSAVCTVAAALVIYKIVLSAAKNVTSALIAALAFGTFPLIWSQAIITEVNALHALFVALVLYLFVVAASSPSVDFLGGLILGLSLGNHMSTVFLLPFVLVHNVALPDPAVSSAVIGSKRSEWVRSVARRLVGLWLGLSVYLLLPLRARAQAPVNWGNAVDWNGLSWLVSGQAYWNRLGDFDLGYLITGVKAWSHFIVLQLGVVGLLLIVVTLSTLVGRSRLFLATGWLAVAYSVFSILYYSPDSNVYLVAALIACAIWIGLGAGWIADKASLKSGVLKPIAAAVISVLLVARAVLAIPAMDLSGNRDAERVAQDILSSAPRSSMVIATGDEMTFALWYVHYAIHERPDLAVVCRDLFPQAWYRSVLAYTYPDLSIPEGPFAEGLFQANPTRPYCVAALEPQPHLDCTGGTGLVRNP